MSPIKLVWYWSHVPKSTRNETMKKAFDGPSKNTGEKEKEKITDNCKSFCVKRKRNLILVTRVQSNIRKKNTETTFASPSRFAVETKIDRKINTQTIAKRYVLTRKRKKTTRTAIAKLFTLHAKNKKRCSIAKS